MKKITRLNYNQFIKHSNQIGLDSNLFFYLKKEHSLSKAIETNVEHIMRSQTDSLYSSIKLHDLVNLVNNMGDIKYTGSCINANIHHANLVDEIYN